MSDSGFLALRAGEHGTVDGVDGSQLSSKRLADLGFVRGAEITMVRPGSPCIVRLGGCCVGLGSDHQLAIQLAVG